MKFGRQSEIHPIVELVFWPRVIGSVLVMAMVSTVYWQQDQSWELWAVLLWFGLVWAHLARLHAILASDSKKAEFRNLVADIVLFGFLTGTSSFNPWITMSLLVAMGMNSTVNGGLRLLMLNIPFFAVAAGLGGWFNGFAISMESAPSTPVLSGLSLFLYANLLTLQAFRRNRQLGEAKRKINQQHQQINQANQEISHMMQAMRTINATLDLNQVLASVQKIMAERHGFNQIGILMADENGKELLFSMSHFAIGLTKKQIDFFEAVRLDLKTSNSAYANVIRSGEPSLFSNVQAMLPQMVEQDQLFMQINPARGVVLLPLNVYGKVIGVLHLARTDEVLNLEEEEITKIQSFVDQIAVAVNNARMATLTEKALAEAKIQAQELQEFNQITQVINSSLKFNKVIQTVGQTLINRFHFDQFALILLDASDGTLDFDAMQWAIGMEPAPIEFFKNIRINTQDSNSVYATVIRSGEPSVFVDINEILPLAIELDQEFIRINPVKSVALIPLVVKGDVIGLVHLATIQKGFTPTDAELSKLQYFVDQVATAVHNARMAEQTELALAQAQIKELEVMQLNQLANLVTSSLSFEEMIRTLGKSLVERFKFDQFCILLLDEKTNRLRFNTTQWAIGMTEEQTLELSKLPLLVDQGNSVYTAVVRSGEPSYFPNIPEYQPTMVEVDYLCTQINPVQTVALFPMKVRGKVVGVVHLSSTSRQIDLSEEEFNKIQHFVNQISSAVNNAHLADLTEQALAEARAKEAEILHLNQVARTVNSTLSLEEVMASVKGALAELFDFEQMAMIMIDHQEQVLRIYTAYGDIPQRVKDRIEHLIVPMSDHHSFLVKTVLHNEPHLVSPVTPELLELFTENDRKTHEIVPFQSALMMPVEVKGQVEGLITFTSTSHTFEIDEEGVKKVGRYVSHIAAALRNAYAFEELKRTKVQLAESERIAAMTRTFEKFVPRQFLNRLAKRGMETIELGMADSAEITLMFADIRGFSSLSESLTPQELLNFLNAYLKRVSEPIHSNHGFVDKFIGDAVMALFDRPHEGKDLQASDAIKAAIAIQEAIKVYNIHRAKSGYLPVQVGIGIHSGPLVFGTVGTQSRMESTVLGDVVNLASRLEGLTKYYGCEVIISSSTYRLLDEKNHLTRELDFVNVKGKSKPIAIFEVFDFDPPEIRDKKQAMLPLWHQALLLYHMREWENALEDFRGCLYKYPEDIPSKLYVQRCLQHFKQAPDKNWDGTQWFDQK